MNTGTNNIGILIQISFAFGSIIVALLSMMLFFLKRHINTQDVLVDQVNEHDTEIKLHNNRIGVLEKSKFKTA